MENADVILVVSFFLISFISFVGSTHRTGYVYMSPHSLSNLEKAKFETNKEGMGPFIGTLSLVFIVSLLYGFVVSRDLTSTLLFSLASTAAAAYGLAHLLLLKEKR